MSENIRQNRTMNTIHLAMVKIYWIKYHQYAFIKLISDKTIINALTIWCRFKLSFNTLYTQISFFLGYNLFNVLVISMLSISLNEKFELKNQILIDDTYQFCSFSNDLWTRYLNTYILFSHLPFPSHASRSNDYILMTAIDQT